MRVDLAAFDTIPLSYWSPKGQNPRLKHQKPLHSPKVTVWCALSSNGIIGLLRRVARNTEARFQECVRRDGHHLDDIIFK